MVMPSCTSICARSSSSVCAAAGTAMTKARDSKTRARGISGMAGFRKVARKYRRPRSWRPAYQGKPAYRPGRRACSRWKRTRSLAGMSSSPSARIMVMS